MMEKAGETLAVHRTCVTAHQAAGWRVAEVQAEPVDPAPTVRKRKTKETPNETNP